MTEEFTHERLEQGKSLCKEIQKRLKSNNYQLRLNGKYKQRVHIIYIAYI